MGFTYEKGKAVIWTTKRFICYEFPFNDEGENNTFFYKNLYDRTHFLRCLSVLTEQEKLELVSKELSIPANKLLLKSKKSHNKKRSKNTT